MDVTRRTFLGSMSAFLAGAALIDDGMLESVVTEKIRTFESNFMYVATGKFNIWITIGGYWRLLTDASEKPFEFDSDIDARLFAKRIFANNFVPHEGASDEEFLLFNKNYYVTRKAPTETFSIPENGIFGFGHDPKEAADIMSRDSLVNYTSIMDDINLAYDRKIGRVQNPASFAAIIMTLDSLHDGGIFWSLCLYNPKIKQKLLLLQNSKATSHIIRGMFCGSHVPGIRTKLGVFRKTYEPFVFIQEKFGFKGITFFSDGLS